MKIANIIGAGAVLVGMSIFSFTSAQAASLGSPDSDALVAAYQLVQFDLQECRAIQGPASMANGNGVVSPDILDVSSKICGDANSYQPMLKKLAADKDFDLPTELPYSLTARYAALERNKGPGLGIRYLNDQISSHEDALAVFQDEAANGTDPDVKAAAIKVLPTVQSNLDLLKSTLAKHGG
jgi:putative membrane protein